METELVRLKAKSQITLPAKTKKKAGLQEGDWLEVSFLSDGSISLSPKVLEDKELNLKIRLQKLLSKASKHHQESEWETGLPKGKEI